MSVKETIKRYGLFIVSLFFIGLGIGFAKLANLGISPISSVPNVMSIKFTFLTLGEWLLVANMIFLICQILLLRRRFKPVQLLQIPLSFAFAYFTDFGVWLVKSLPADIYALRLLWVIVGTVVIGFGVALGVIANAILNSPEALMKVIADLSGKEFSMIKVIFDVSWVTIGVILSLIFFKGQLVGIREGTVICAVFVGFVVKFFIPLLKNPLTKFLTK